MQLSHAAAAAVLLAGAGQAHAQLLFGTADRTDPFYLVDLDTIRLDTSFPVPANVADAFPLPGTTTFAPWAMTADEVNREVIFLEIGPLFPGAPPSSNLYRMPYDTLVPQLVGTIRERQTGFNISIQGLGFDAAANKLFGFYNVGGTPGRGVYEIPLPPPGAAPQTLQADRVLAFSDLPGGEAFWNITSMDWDPVTGDLYAINNGPSAGQGRGLYKLDIDAGTVEFIVASPSYRRANLSFQGLALGDGKAFWTTDDPGFVYVYDFATGTFDDFLSPVLTQSTFGGAAWAPGLIPEPAAALSLAGAGMLMLRRRR